MKEFIFVYGTLMAKINHKMHFKFRQYTSFVGQGFTYGKLYLVSYYPALILDNSQKNIVKGEVYQIENHNLFKWLDKYEGLFDKPPLYFKQKIKVFLYPKQVSLLAWCYIYARSSKKLIFLEKGDFYFFWQNSHAS
ncbi:Uncharacterized conserved protein YtfP, gamma-glutamylcyclotransferase (GGCT)/AIG2-like family [Desulfonauticus submarinus]|uniref:Uncharacterized conserved protein YtfP, gamma-glutamylcyclotransferase (GGCT)/AIG2-like family n=1 Tax=Desulfonauticus submarinus TaxID=206665 RepID=A0A1H0CFB3_9BACT|nr:gamma-glutamylcyclotransferase family protein [Desulfonauticus submarinus]SDN56481.1 Uncharacterized conserved protein YtfP, gamma-glutamylcyclotransferase (GGCT)/AIG2-like family [Desulfonauticus submarinus]